MSITIGIEMGFLPLLIKEEVKSVSALISGKTSLGFMISASILSVVVSPK
jgi:hypothetical protein